MSSDRHGLRSAGAHGALRRLASSGRHETPIDRLRILWAEVAPRAVAHSRPERLSRAGVLTVACDDAGWAQELSAHAGTLLARLSTAAPELALTKVRFAVGAGGVSPDWVPSAPPRRPRPTPAERAAADDAVREVADPELRERLRRAVAAGLALQRNRARGGSP